MMIMVVDGQGGGIGKALIEKLLPILTEDITLIAVGTNSQATANMLKAGHLSGATGENAIVYNAKQADLIVGSIGIIAANSMLGELSPKMAQAISQSNAIKILIPLNMCNLRIVGGNCTSLPQKIEDATNMIKVWIHSEKDHC